MNFYLIFKNYKMKSPSLFAAFMCLLLSFTSFGQSQDIKKEMDQALKEMSKALEQIDLNQLINEDLFAKIEESKPTSDQLKEIESVMIQSIESLNAVDFSAMEELIKEMEKSMEKINFDKLIESVDPVKPATKGKKI